MSATGLPPERVPTLTEVVAWPGSPAAPATPRAVEAELAAPGLPAGLLPSEEQIVQRVLGELQRQVDLMLEYRLREALTPLLTRATDGLIREARAELASTLRDVVARVVSQELARHRPR